MRQKIYWVMFSKKKNSLVKFRRENYFVRVRVKIANVSDVAYVT